MASCKKCGARLEEDDSFCPGCGARRDEPATEVITAKKKSKKLPLVIALAVVACIAIVCGVAFFVHQENERIWNEEHREYPVVFSFEGATASSDVSTVPVRVTGTDFEGGSVSCTELVDVDSPESIYLMRGSYTFSVPSDLICDSGSLCSTSVSSPSFEISESSESDTDEVAPVSTVSITPVDDSEVSDERIEKAYEGLKEAGMSEEAASNLRGKAEAHHSEYVTAKKSEELKEAKQQFRSRLAAIKKAEQSDSRMMTGSQSEMNQCAYDYFGKRDALLSEVCEFVASNLTDSEASALKASQQKWEANRSTAMENAWKYPNGDTSAAPQQYHTLAPIEANSKGDELTEARIEELLGMI